MKSLVVAGIVVAGCFIGAVPFLVIWYSVEDLGRIGEFLQGVGQVALAFGVIAGGGWALWRYFRDRDRQVEERRHQADVDVARLSGDLVTMLRRRSEGTEDVQDRQVFMDRLVQAELPR